MPLPTDYPPGDFSKRLAAAAGAVISMSVQLGCICRRQELGFEHRDRIERALDETFAELLGNRPKSHTASFADLKRVTVRLLKLCLKELDEPVEE
jgi:hypothetical protein